MCLECITLMKYTGELSITGDLWPNDPPSLSQLRELLKDKLDVNEKTVCLDPSAAAADIKRTFAPQEEDIDDEGEGPDEEDEVLE